MLRILPLVAVLLLTACAASDTAPAEQPPVKVVSAQDATAEWNYLYGAFNFDAYPCGTNTTFEQAYNGSDFANDFEAIIRGVSNLMATNIPPIDGDELLNATLTNWPDQ